MQNTINFLLAILYALIGLCMAVAGIETLRDKANKARIELPFLVLLGNYFCLWRLDSSCCIGCDGFSNWNFSFV